jgi:hypothetical protein
VIERSSFTQREVFDLQLERVRLKAMLLLATPAAAGADPASPSVEAQRHKLEVDLAAIEARLVEVRRAELQVSFRHVRLADAVGLAPQEVELLWAAVAVSSDPRIQPHAVLLGGTDARRGLTLPLFATLSGLDGTEARRLTLSLGASHPLFRHHLLGWAEETGAPAARALSVPSRVAAFLAGDDTPDEALAVSGERLTPPPVLHFDAAQEGAMKRVHQAVATPDSQALGAESGDPVLLALEGPVGSGRRTAVAQAAAAAGRRVVALDVRRLAPTVEALERALIALRRECLLWGAIPLIAEIDDLHADGENAARMRALARAIDESPGLVVLTTSQPGIDFGSRRRLLRVVWPVPDTTTRRALWVQALGDDAAGVGADLDMVAHRYRLGAGGVRRAVETSRLIAQAHDGAGLGIRDLVEGVRNNIAERLGGLASRVEVRQSWEDLVLAPDTLDQVHALVARVRHAHQVFERWGFHRKMPRGVGVAGLFSGPPGTGKTMVAGLIARDLDLELYQVDLSKVVSKWVGETEKQLGKIFEAAEAGHALLLFDEADSLFAKRTADVKSATDRYANLEVNYLLQRIESFGGITILTTNMDTSIDPALRRRLAANIVFWSPDVQERLTLWKRLLPKEAPVADGVNFTSLAERFPDMTGANIRNAVLAAAFLAASENVSISQQHLERAARGEYRAMGRILGQPA